jgi:predicted RNA-binding Zn ribbon-like protein
VYDHDLTLPERVGGALVLDFINTRDAWLSEAHRREFLPDYAALIAWAIEAGALDARGGAALRQVDPQTAAEVHERALALREALFGVFAPLAGRPPGRTARAALAAVNAAWRGLATRPQLDPETLTATWTDAPDRPLGPVLESAGRLLEEGPLDRLRQCPGPDGWCGWLFIDRTKNRSRRWCSMSVCGNPAKMRARAERRRAASR